MVSSIEQINWWLFSLLNASATPNFVVLYLAKFFAVIVIYLLPLFILTAWLQQNPAWQKLALRIVFAAIFSMLVNYIIGLIWFHPRPFTIPLGHHYLFHNPDSSFPSNHFTLMLIFAFNLLSIPFWRNFGQLVLLLALAVGWSRIYLGIHFPLDMLGSFVVALVSTILVKYWEPVWLPKLFPLLRHFYRKLCAPLIKLGWFAK